MRNSCFLLRSSRSVFLRDRLVRESVNFRNYIFIPSTNVRGRTKRTSTPGVDGAVYLLHRFSVTTPREATSSSEYLIRPPPLKSRLERQSKRVFGFTRTSRGFTLAISNRISPFRSVSNKSISPSPSQTLKLLS